jgi:hypothetical protein
MSTRRTTTEIYFAGSIRGGRADQDLYQEMIRHLQGYGDVLTEHVGDGDLSIDGTGEPPDVEIHRQDTGWLRRANVLVAEVSTPSLGVGYEIAKAEEWGKPILCLYRPGEGRYLSAMIAGSDALTVKEYRNLEEAVSLIDEFLNSTGLARHPAAT